MALELCSENSSRAMSPRISFSHDLSQSDVVPVEQLLRSISSSSVDFNFCVLQCSDEESSMADELFFDGKILPTKVKKRVPSKTPAPASPAGARPVGSPDSDGKRNTKSFWGFKRSHSLNCGSGYARTLCPLPILSRSNSTGSSSSSSKRSSLSSKDGLNPKQQSQQQRTLFSPKPPLKKAAHNGPYGNRNGVRVNPVLNVPSASMFGLGSIFPRDKSKKK